jgi:hypothetical protein
MERSLLLSALETALALAAKGDTDGTVRRYAVESAQEWLAIWPGDFRARGLLAKALIATGDTENALVHLRQAVEADPESVEALSGLIPLLQKNNQASLAAEADACRFALDPTVGMRSAAPEWSEMMQSAMGMARAGRWQEARWAAESALRASPAFPLPALVHLKAMLQLADYSSAMVTANEYRKRWPACIAFSLLAAQAAFSLNRSSEGVEFLHACSIMDPASEVSDRYLGSMNPYKPLWPARLEADLHIPVPQAVVVAAGWNRLGATGPDSQDAVAVPIQSDLPVLPFPDFDVNNPPATLSTAVPPSPIPGEKFQGPSAGDQPKHNRAPKSPSKKIVEASPVDAALEPILETDPGLDALRARLQTISKQLRGKNKIAKSNLRPAYIVVTSLQKITGWYGSGESAIQEKLLQDVVRTKASAAGWSAYLLDVDNEASVKPLGLQPVDAANAWQVKQLLTSLDANLQKRGETIGAVLIIGGHEIIPFHLLPNPATDDDADVPSDNPYSTRDENYLVPEWPVGRIPTPKQAGIPFLQAVLSRLVTNPSSHRKDFWGGFSSWLQLFFRPLSLRYVTASGLSAEVWKNASIEVFRDIGPANALVTSPPVTSATVPTPSLSLPTYAYFNVHGMANAPEWLGQSASRANGDAPEFPIALTPALIGKNGKTPRVVYSEACYGSHVQGKEPATAISLKFLESGAGAIVGSTRIGYGAANAPLIAADLLGRYFLTNCQKGMASGDAMRQAKISFAEDMRKRQGYLDPEDQKTLISFVLYGDPLFTANTRAGKTVRHNLAQPSRRSGAIPLLRASSGSDASGEPSESIQRNLKKELRRYLPGIAVSSIKYWQPMMESSADTTEPADRKSKKAASPRTPAWVIGMENTYTIQGQSVTHFVRMSVNARGKVMKLVVSK